MDVYGPYDGIVLDWHDGDTAHINLDLGFGQTILAYNVITGKPQWSCRILGINAPELKTGAPGAAATEAANRICPPGTLVKALSRGWDKYGGRWDGVLTLPNGDDFATLMLAGGHAVPMKV